MGWLQFLTTTHAKKVHGLSPLELSASLHGLAGFATLLASQHSTASAEAAGLRLVGACATQLCADFVSLLVGEGQQPHGRPTVPGEANSQQGGSQPPRSPLRFRVLGPAELASVLRALSMLWLRRAPVGPSGAMLWGMLRGEVARRAVAGQLSPRVAAEVKSACISLFIPSLI